MLKLNATKRMLATAIAFVMVFSVVIYTNVAAEENDEYAYFTVSAPIKPPTAGTDDSSGESSSETVSNGVAGDEVVSSDDSNSNNGCNSADENVINEADEKADKESNESNADNYTADSADEDEDGYTDNYHDYGYNGGYTYSYDYDYDCNYNCGYTSAEADEEYEEYSSYSYEPVADVPAILPVAMAYIAAFSASEPPDFVNVQEPYGNVYSGYRVWVNISAGASDDGLSAVMRHINPENLEVEIKSYPEADDTFTILTSRSPEPPYDFFIFTPIEITLSPEVNVPRKITVTVRYMGFERTITFTVYPCDGENREPCDCGCSDDDEREQQRPAAPAQPPVQDAGSDTHDDTASDAPAAVPQVVAASIAANDGVVSLQVRITDNNAALSFTASAINALVDSADGNVITLDLSSLDDVESLTLPRAAMRQFANAELGLEIILPQGTIALSAEAVQILAQVAGRSRIAVAVTSIEGELVVTITAGGVVINELESMVTVS